MKRLLTAMLFSLGCIPKPLPVLSPPEVSLAAEDPNPVPVVVIHTTLDEKVLTQWSLDHSGFLEYYKQFPFSVVESGVSLPSTLDANAVIQAYLHEGYHALFDNKQGSVSLVTYYFRILSDNHDLREQIKQRKESLSTLAGYDPLVRSSAVPEETLQRAYARAFSSLQETQYTIPSPPSGPLVFYLVPNVSYVPEHISTSRKAVKLADAHDNAFFHNISPSVLLGRKAPLSPSFVTEITLASVDASLSSDSIPYVSVTTYFDVPSPLITEISSLVRQGAFAEIRDKYREQLEQNTSTQIYDSNRDGLHALEQPEKYDELCVTYKTGDEKTRACHSFALTRERKDDLLAACVSDASSPQCLQNKDSVAYDLELQQRTVAWYNHTLGLLDARISEATTMLDSDTVTALLEVHRLGDEIIIRKKSYELLLRDKYAVNPAP